MKNLLYLLNDVWRTALAFRLASGYLLLLAFLVLVLPWLPLPYSPNELDLDQVYARPFDWDQFSASGSFHWFGTDGLGRDLLANVLYGARTAFMLSLPVMLLAVLLGLLIGAIAGFYGNRRTSLSCSSALMLLLSVPAFFYYSLYLPSQLLLVKAPPADYLLSLAMSLAFPVILLFGVAPLLGRFTFFCRRIHLPVDQLVLRLIEVNTSIPRLVLILVFAAIMPPTLPMLSLLLVLTFWTEPARLARAEMLRIRELPFFEAATGLGIPKRQLITHHALPHLLAPVLVAFSFGLAGLLMLESTLSFLNIGVSAELVSWGRIISGIRSNTAAWWLVVIPGVFLSGTVLALQICSYYILRAINQSR